MDDFANAIAYEVKLEIANRYFGFRTGIESEISRYVEKLHETEKTQLEAIRLDLRRLRVLLHTEQLFHDFLRLVGFPRNPSLIESAPAPPPGGLFAGLRGEGITRSWRFRDLAARIYKKLGDQVDAYRQTCRDLGEEYSGICTRIDTFHRNNDLTGILEFLRTFESADSERLKFLHAVSTSGPGNPRKNLDQDLRIAHPPQVAEILPPLPALPSIHAIRPNLKSLLQAAYPRHHRAGHDLPL